MKTSRFNRILSALLAIVLFLGCVPVFPVLAQEKETFRVTLDGEDLTTLGLYPHEKLKIQAAGLENGENYQWQILHPERENVWVSIYDAKTDSLNVTLALVKNMLTEAGTTQLRCRANAEGQQQFTAPITVTMLEEQPALIAEPEETIPVETTVPTEPIETTVSTEPAQTTPVEITVSTEPVETAPVETTVSTEPVETTPVETTVSTEPVETVPVETTVATEPVETVPVETTFVTEPMETTSVEATDPTETFAAQVSETVEPAPMLFAAFSARNAALPLAEGDAETEETTVPAETPEFVTVTIEYIRYDYQRDSNGNLVKDANGALVLDDGTPAFTSYVATLKSHTNLDTVVNNPTMVGYNSYLNDETATSQSVHISLTDLTEDKTYTVKYKPKEVSYMVRYYFQNVYDDQYVEDTSHKVIAQGYTGAVPPDSILEKEIAGFTSLYHQPDSIAADGSTVFEAYYERNYYLMEFDCDQGYGTDTLYIRYGSYISVPSPVRSGWVFGGWDLVSTEASGSKENTEDGMEDLLPEIMPCYNTAYKALWNTTDTTYTVAYWIKNADNSVSYLGGYIKNGTSNSQVSGRDDLGKVTATTPIESLGKICGYGEHTHINSCLSCNHLHTSTCYEGLGKGSPSSQDQAAFAAIGSGEPQSGYTYLIEATGDSKKYYYIRYGDTWYYKQNDPSCIAGEPLGQKGQYTEGGRTWTATKYNTAGLSCAHAHSADCKSLCGLTEHTHTASCLQDTRHLSFVGADTVTIEGDGSSVVNVYYEYKTYTLKFYYAATTGGTDSDGDNINDKDFASVKIVGGSTYYFGYHYGPNTSDDAELLDNMFTTTGQCGDVTGLPTLNQRGIDRRYQKGGLVSGDTTYHYISFSARYGDDISDMWPCGVFNSATRKDTSNSSGWSGTEAFVSAWNGEHHVAYSRNDNETIKGVYEKLDEQLLFHTDYADETEVSYLCFWENGAPGVDWSVPELYIYKIWLSCLMETKDGVEVPIIPEGKDYRTKDGITYYLADSYNTCDDSNIQQQTVPALTGYNFEVKNWAAYFISKAYQVNNVYRTSGKKHAEYENGVVYSGDDDIDKSLWWKYSKVLDIKPQSNTDFLLYDEALYNPTSPGTEINHNKYREAYEVDFFYKARQRKLIFWNHNDYLTDGTGVMLAYGTPLQKYGAYVNETYMKAHYPSGLEPGAYEFKGWYTTADCLDGSEMDWTGTMPDHDMTVYAKWEPIKRNVTFYTYYSDIGDSTKQPFLEAENVPHGTRLGSAYYEIPTAKEGYKFIGWFYMDEDKKKRFAPDSMEITRDLVLFAEWNTTIDTTYEVKYVLKDAVTKDNTVTHTKDYEAGDEVASLIFAHSSVGKTKTFSAKGLSELYPDFREKFFPTVNSHSILMDQDEKQNQFIFEYVFDPIVYYKVRYVDYTTGEELAPSAVKTTEKAIVTEKFLPIANYIPQSYYLRKAVAYDGTAAAPIEANVITFYYTKDTAHGMFSEEHYQERLDADDTVTDYLDDPQNYSQYESFVGTEDINETYTATERSYEGFELHTDLNTVVTYNETNQEAVTLFKYNPELVGNPPRGKVTANGLAVRMYYKRIDYPYIIEYREYGAPDTDDPLKTVTTDTSMAKFGRKVSHTADPELTINDLNGNELKYEYYPAKATAEERTKSMTIRVYTGSDDPATPDINEKMDENPNKLVFYYAQKQTTVEYIVVCDDSSLESLNAVSMGQESAALASNLSGSTAMPGSGFRFVGWYTDRKCTGDPLTTEVAYKPEAFAPDEDGVDRYYAKFEPILTSLAITKEVADKDKNGAAFVEKSTDSFLFRITGKANTSTKDVNMIVAINGSGSVIVENLNCGEYTVTELTDWSWKYDCRAKAVTKRVVALTEGGDFPETNIFAFTNTYNNPDWLGGENYYEARFS